MSKYRRRGETGRDRARSTKKTDPFYNSKAWHRFRWHVRERDNWTCTRCGADVRGGGAHVDHVVPRSVAPERALDMTNARTLCHGCHSRKTVNQDGGFGRERRAFDPADTAACDTSGRPLDAAHPWSRD